MDYQRYKNLPNALKEYRKRQGLTQKAVADQLGIDSDWISHWEHGDTLPNLVSVIRLSVLYQAPFEKLFSELVKVIHKETVR